MQQSQELDPKKRLALVREIERKLEADGARPMLGWRQAVLRALAAREGPGPHDNSIYN